MNTMVPRTGTEPMIDKADEPEQLGIQAYYHIHKHERTTSFIRILE